jgi:hypothetical protein
MQVDTKSGPNVLNILKVYVWQPYTWQRVSRQKTGPRLMYVRVQSNDSFSEAVITCAVRPLMRGNEKGN